MKKEADLLDKLHITAKNDMALPGYHLIIKTRFIALLLHNVLKNMHSGDELTDRAAIFFLKLIRCLTKLKRD